MTNEQLEQYFKDLGMPIYMDDLNIPKSDLLKFSLKISDNKKRIVPDFIKLDYEVMKDIFERMWL